MNLISEDVLKDIFLYSIANRVNYSATQIRSIMLVSKRWNSSILRFIYRWAKDENIGFRIFISKDISLWDWYLSSIEIQYLNFKKNATSVSRFLEIRALHSLEESQIQRLYKIIEFLGWTYQIIKEKNCYLKNYNKWKIDCDKVHNFCDCHILNCPHKGGGNIPGSVIVIKMDIL
jgi:hypothetical protein